jgi:hypothetical protein
MGDMGLNHSFFALLLAPMEIGEAKDWECPHCFNDHSLECQLLSPQCGKEKQPVSSDDVINTVSYASVQEGGTPRIEEIRLTYGSETAGQTSEGNPLHTIASFQPLFREFSNLHILSSEYVRFVTYI